MFIPTYLGKMNPFWRAYFSDGWFNHQPVHHLHPLKIWQLTKTTYDHDTMFCHSSLEAQKDSRNFVSWLCLVDYFLRYFWTHRIHHHQTSPPFGIICLLHFFLSHHWQSRVHPSLKFQDGLDEISPSISIKRVANSKMMINQKCTKKCKKKHHWTRSICCLRKLGLPSWSILPTWMS